MRWELERSEPWDRFHDGTMVLPYGCDPETLRRLARWADWHSQRILVQSPLPPAERDRSLDGMHCALAMVAVVCRCQAEDIGYLERFLTFWRRLRGVFTRNALPPFGGP